MEPHDPRLRTETISLHKCGWRAQRIANALNAPLWAVLKIIRDTNLRFKRTKP
jgi:hypothetical protein